MEEVAFTGSEVVVSNPQSLKTKISSIRRAGPAKLQVFPLLLFSKFLFSCKNFIFIIKNSVGMIHLKLMKRQKAI